MKNSVGFLEEKPGIKSSTRLKSFILLAALIFLDWLIMRRSGFEITTAFTSFNFVLLLGIFTPQYLHKIIELKSGKNILQDNKE